MKRITHVWLMAAVLSAPVLWAGDSAAEISLNDEGKKLALELQKEVSRLRKELTAIDEADSTSQQRRAYKRVVRAASKLVEQYPESSGRFDLLRLAFEAQRALMVVDDSQANAQRFLEVCQALAKAPNECAALRLPADLVLTEIEISRAGDDKGAVAAVIAKVVDRYRKTPSEVDCLMAATDLTMDNGCKELHQELKNELKTRFIHELRVIDYLTNPFDLSVVGKPSPFRGTFERTDGTPVVFPKDNLGKPYVVCYWSENTAFLGERMGQVKDLQDKCNVTVFSINVDGLPDHGQARLKRMGLNWIALQLPEERKVDIGLVHERPLYTAVDEKGLGLRFSFRVPTYQDIDSLPRSSCLQAYMMLKYWKGALKELNLFCSRQDAPSRSQNQRGLAEAYAMRATVNENLGKEEAAVKDRQAALDKSRLAIQLLERWAAGAHKSGQLDKAKRIRAQADELRELAHSVDRQLEK